MIKLREVVDARSVQTYIDEPFFIEGCTWWLVSDDGVKLGFARKPGGRATLRIPHRAKEANTAEHIERQAAVVRA